MLDDIRAPGAIAPKVIPITIVDARIKTKQFFVCEFAGQELAPSKLRQCQHFDKSRQRSCCCWYEGDITTDEYPDRGICRQRGDF
jgi:hypothetical protein